MKRIYKIFIILFVSLGLFSAFLAIKCSNSGYVKSDDMIINKYNQDIVIDEQGNMHVKEVLVIDNIIDRYNNYFYKEIAYNKNNMFGNSSLNTSQLVKDVRLTVEDDSGVVYDSETSNNEYPRHFAGYSYENDRDERGYSIRCETRSTYCDNVFYYNKAGFSAITTFTYEYTIKGVITQYYDISEFNWVLLDYQPFKFNDITINITLPEGDYDIANEKTFFHGTNMAKREFVDNNKIVITADDMVSDEKIEVRLLLDNEVFDYVSDRNKVSYTALDSILEFEENQEKTANKKYMIGYFGAFVMFGLFISLTITLVVIFYKKYDKEHKSDFYNEYYRELPADYSPAVMGYLYKFREIDDDDLTATLLDLIRRKYLLLDPSANSGYDEKKPNYTIRLNKDKAQDDLTASERYLISWFIKEIGNGDSVTSKELSTYCDNYSHAQQYQRSSQTWYNMVKSEARKYNFFDENVKKAKNTCSVIGFFLGAITSMILSALSNYSGYKIGGSLIPCVILFTMAIVMYTFSIDKRSKKGNEDYVRWKAFKKFLEDFSSFEDYPLPSIIIWEHYLVYATSFGIADKVSEQLKLKFKLEEISNADCTFVVYFGFNHRIGRFNRTVGGMRMSASTTIVRYQTAQRAGSSFGGRGGGGFSGGSSFGGGGGSFGGGRR